MAMIGIAAILASVVLEITASIVPCVMNVQTHNDNGETVWEVMYNDEGYGTEKNCQYQLIPNYENAEILYVEFRELYLVSKSGTCSALFEINGESFCHVPYQHRCTMFRLIEDDISCQQFENPLQCEARIWKMLPPTVAVKSKATSHDERRVHFIYQYINCSRATSILSGRSRAIGMQWSTWPEITDNASPTTPASTFDSMAVTIPLLILLIVILAVLLSIIIIRKPCAEKHKGDISSYDIRKQSDNSPIAREYGTIENEYENVDKIKPGHSDEKQVVYNAIYETSS